MNYPNAKRCATCRHAEEHGWWGPDHVGTHCATCCRSWTGKAEAHCTHCCAHFTRDSLASLHRTPSGACQLPAVVLRKDGEPVFRLVARASGPVWASAAVDNRFAAAS